jgi:hypothetical protein
LEKIWRGAGDMDRKVKLPIGIEDFEKLRTEGFYYVDKTGLITELLNNWGEVNLFTRPRRFGKSLNMSMLRAFFAYGCNPKIFEGLAIAGERELCDKYMGKFPVVSITLKGVEAKDYAGARAMMAFIIGNEALRFHFLSESNKLSELERKQYDQLTKIDEEGRYGFIMSEDVIKNSLLILTRLLRKHYGQKVVLLIDEYDVPLDKAQQFGYYEEMVSLVRNMLGQALKSNDSLQFAVLTGCLRIAKESIFTGLNNFNVLSITNVRFEEHFGFSDEEVKDMLDYYGLADKYRQIKEWYDGYRFGKTDVYCPWDVINYVNLLRSEPEASPRAFWINTSGNYIIRQFLRMATPRTRREIERLLAGESVKKKVNQELTYRELYQSIDNLWSVLFTTGYLTCKEAAEEDVYSLVIPNLEIRKIFAEQVMEWFQEEARKDAPMLDEFCWAFAKGDGEAVERLFTAYLKKTISIRDTSVRKGKKENFYHGILLGLLSHRGDWDVDSNIESGDGYSDIQVEIEEESIGLVIEVKYADNGDLEAGCKEAFKQIEETGYEERLKEDGMTRIIRYGIACWKKSCMVRVEKEESC